MNWYYFLILVFMPIIGNGENCTILWNLDNFQTRMKIKMCIEPIEESLFFVLLGPKRLCKSPRIRGGGPPDNLTEVADSRNAL